MLNQIIRTLPGTFSPPNISGQGCQLWFRADKGIHIGTGVSQWDDQSGNGINPTNVTGSKQPTYTASSSSYNGCPILSSVAASQRWLYHGSTPVIAAPYTILLSQEYPALQGGDELRT